MTRQLPTPTQRRQKQEDEKTQRQIDERRRELQLYLAVALAGAVAIGLLVGVPLWSFARLSEWTRGTGGIDVWGPMIAILVSVTSMSVSGIFVFMSFRIDRGVKREARETTMLVVDETVRDIFEGAGVHITKNIDSVKTDVNDTLKSAKRKVDDIDATVGRVKTTVGAMETKVDELGSDIAASRATIEEQLDSAQERIDKLFVDAIGTVSESFEGVRKLGEKLRWELFVPRLRAEPRSQEVTLRWTTYVLPPDGLTWEYRMWEPNGEYGKWKPATPHVRTEGDENTQHENASEPQDDSGDPPETDREKPDADEEGPGTDRVPQGADEADRDEEQEEQDAVREWTCDIPGLIEDRIYGFVVRAKTPWGGEVSSNEVSAKTLSPSSDGGPYET